ncbi:uncharacterized protein VP01_4555g3 [Puccinia sorghi]|uniref:DUF4219 domain-containing protein n=1 Tax=Puccinia sorghi TaxID=27349 RepID=A0A0L6UPK6_9BASI|nr:uncharacterized protein VP01_4555g3 [Puccinia sorghi]
MANNKESSNKANIPKLDEKNFLHWSMRMKDHLHHKGLIKHALKPPVVHSGAAAKEFAKKHHETVNILMNYMNKTVFELVVTPDKKESTHQIWMTITSKFTSKSINNKAKVWLYLMR